MFLKRWNKNKNKKTKKLPFTYTRERAAGNIVLNTDMDIDSDEVLDYLERVYKENPGAYDLLEFINELSRMAGFEKNNGCSIIVVHEGSWEVYLSRDAKFEV